MRTLNRPLALLMACVLFFAPFVALALADALPPELTAGLQWLNAQIKTTGEVTGESGSVATASQVRYETHEATSLLGSASESLRAWLGQDDTDETEFMARRALQLALADRPDAGLLSRLSARQNADGGFAGAGGGGSQPLDTAFSLLAYKKTGGLTGSQVQQSLGYLLSTKRADGGWGPGASNVYDTANVLLAANAWSSSYAVGQIVNSAQTWLLAHRGSSGHFDAVLENAIALIALSTQTSQPDVLKPIADALKAAQSGDGSWSQDPYQTALALRALWFVGKTPSVPVTGEVAGAIVDAGTSQALSGVTVQVVENTSFATTSDAVGSFAISGLSQAGYTLRLSKLGYETRDLSVSITNGKQTAVGSILLRKQSLTASLSGVVKTSGNQPIASAIVTVGTQSVLTSATGAYELSGIAPGAATITVIKTGYSQVSASVDFLAGKTYVFSPALYAGAAPTTATFKGKVVDSVNTNTAIAGAKVTVGGTSATTAADGTFTLTNLTAGSFTATVTASGYQDFGATGALVNGINDAGVLAIVKAPATSTLTGKVTDAVTGAPVSGAAVTVVGPNLSATTNASGEYKIANVSVLTFPLAVSAANYQTRSYDVSLQRVGPATIDVQLAQSQTSKVAIESLTVSKPQYDPGDEFSLEFDVVNGGTQSIDAIVDAQIIDANGQVSFEMFANKVGLGANPPNLPVSITAGASKELELERFLLSQPAGSYTAIVRAKDTSGLVLAEKSIAFNVLEKPLLSGGVDLTPPLVQAGTNTPVQIKALLNNRGNAPVPAGSVKVKATLVNRDTSAAPSAQATVATTATGGLLSSATAMARDASGNLLVANQSDGRILRVTPNGEVSIYYTIASNKSPNIKDMTVDAQGNVWLANNNNKVWKISPALEFSEIVLTQLSSLLALDVDAAGDLYFTGTATGGETRLVKRVASTATETVLWRNGLSGPMGMTQAGNGDLVVANNTDGSVVRINRLSGAMSVLATGLDRPTGITMGPDGDFYVTTASSANAVVRIRSNTGEKSVYASGLASLADLKFDANGTLFVTSQSDNSIYKVAAGGGSFQLFAKGVANKPYGLGYDANGTLYLANTADGGTLSALDADGTVRSLATALGSVQGLSVIAPNDVMVVNSSGGSINRVTQSGKQVFASGLSSPYGVSVDGQNVYVSERGIARISVYDLSGASLVRRLEPVIGTPRGTRSATDGSVYFYNTDAGGYITKLVGTEAKVFYKGSISEYAPDPISGGLVAVRSSDVLLINASGVASKLVTLPFTPYGIGVLADGRLVVGNYSAKKAVLVDRGTGAQADLTTLPDYPRMVTTDNAGNIFALLNNSKILRIAALDGAQTQLYGGAEYVYAMAPGAGSSFPFWTNYNRLYAIDEDTGALTTLKSSGFSIATSGGVAFANGNVYVSDASAYSVSIYDTAMAVKNRFYGFNGLGDIVAQSGVLTFTDSSDRLYQWNPSSSAYPQLLATGFAAKTLAVRNGMVYGVSGNVLRRWNGSVAANLLTIDGSNDLYGLALNPNGRWYLGDYARSRVHVVNAGETALEKSYASLVKPYGLVFDASGRLLVANNGSNSIERFTSFGQGALPEAFANLTTPRFLTVDTSGLVYASAGSNIYKISAIGAPSTWGPTLTAQGLAIDTSGAVLAISNSDSTAVKYDGANWSVLAAGLSTPARIKVAADGKVYVANQGNGTLVSYLDGAITNKASRLVSPSALALAENSSFLVGGSSGTLVSVDAAGAVTDLKVASLVGTSTRLMAAVQMSADEAYMLSGTTVFKLQISRTVEPPAVGTVVFEQTRTIGGLGVSDEPLSVDFGTMVPPYAGDFHFEVTVDGVEGFAQNFLHAGSFAQGVLAVNVAEVPSGAQKVPLTLKLTGADFTSVSRVETSMVRRLVANEQPLGMTGDKAGAIWYTTTSALKKTLPSGESVTVVSGISPAYGLAVDASENFYLPVRNAQSKFDLLKVSKAGQSSVIAQLGVTSANGVAVNSRGDIFVGSPGKLLRVDAFTSAVSVFTTAGIPSPLGVAVDGRDNMYVQNNSNLVTMIRPDATVQVIYDKGDGVDHPIFEGDGYPTITADCADNFYITASSWKKINQSGEEHILAQVSPRTGTATALFDGTQIS